MEQRFCPRKRLVRRWPKQQNAERAMPTGDLVLGSDGQVSISVGPWAEEKLYYVQHYCNIFNKAMRYKWPRRAYIDLFSGPGKCAIEDSGKELDGSPLVALKREVPFTHYFFNDVREAAVRALRARTQGVFVAPMVFLCQDCNEVVNALLRELGKLPPLKTLYFCFIDPLNWEIEFDSVARLTEGKRMDLVITFHIGNMKRFADQSGAKLDKFFPDSNWRIGYDTRRRSGDTAMGAYLLGVYKQGLERIGYTHIDDKVFVTNSKDVPLYYLLYASKARRGKDFWDKISRKLPTGQGRLFW